MCSDLEGIAEGVSKPWVVLGDYNCVLNREEIIGTVVRDSEVVPFRRCVSKCGLDDMKSTGCFYTWNNKQNGVHRVFCKIDRVLCNDRWSDMFPTVETWFLPEGVFDHTPMLLQVHQVRRGGPTHLGSIRCVQPLTFLNRVREVWERDVRGTVMFCVMQKMKMVLNAMKKLHKEGFNDIHIAETKAYDELIEC